MIPSNREKLSPNVQLFPVFLQSHKFLSGAMMMQTAILSRTVNLRNYQGLITWAMVNRSQKPSIFFAKITWKSYLFLKNLLETHHCLQLMPYLGPDCPACRAPVSPIGGVDYQGSWSALVENRLVYFLKSRHRMKVSEALRKTEDPAQDCTQGQTWVPHV